MWHRLRHSSTLATNHQRLGTLAADGLDRLGLERGSGIRAKDDIKSRPIPGARADMGQGPEITVPVLPVTPDRLRMSSISYQRCEAGFVRLSAGYSYLGTLSLPRKQNVLDVFDGQDPTPLGDID